MTRDEHLEQAEHFKKAGRASRGDTMAMRRYWASRVLYHLRMAATPPQ